MRAPLDNKTCQQASLLRVFYAGSAHIVTLLRRREAERFCKHAIARCSRATSPARVSEARSALHRLSWREPRSGGGSGNVVFQGTVAMRGRYHETVKRNMGRKSTILGIVTSNTNSLPILRTPAVLKLVRCGRIACTEMKWRRRSKGIRKANETRAAFSSLKRHPR